MTRNTHDMDADHFGTADAEKIATGTATSGYVPIATGAGAPAAWGPAASGGGGLTDLLTGDSSIFNSTLGSWTASAGTLTHDGTYAMTGGPGSAKWVNTGTGHIDVPISGTFSQFVDYWAVVWLSWEDTDNLGKNFSLDFGLIGTDAENAGSFITGTTGFPYIGNGNFVAMGVRWRPTADRTGVTFRVSSTNTSTLHVGMLRVWETPIVGSIRAWTEMFSPLTIAASATRESPFGSFGNAGYEVRLNGGININNMNSQAGISLGDNTSHYAYFWSEHPASDLSYEGHEFDVGDDYLALYLSEKDAATYQLYGYDNQDFELRDLGTGHWRITDPGDTLTKNLIEMEQRKGFGSATVASGSTSQSVTHGAGYTPDASDITITPTNNPTNDPGNFWVSSIGATTFTINVRSDPGAGGATFAWRVDR